MKKNTNLYFLSLVIMFALFNVLSFVIPSEKTATFWIAYGFTVFAFASIIVVWKVAFGRKEALKSKFLGIPVVFVTIIYLGVQLIAFVIFKTVPILPEWLTIVICTIILGAFALLAITGQAAKNEISRVEAKIEQKVFFIKSLQADVETLIEAEKNEETKRELRQLAKLIRFSDPMSHNSLDVLEEEIYDKIRNLKISSDKSTLIQEISLLLSERNKKCKILK